jgi:N-acyl-D-amino-acid deacylase
MAIWIFSREALDSDDCVNSLSDGGAHCGTICDAAATTFMLQHWVRDREGTSAAGARSQAPVPRYGKTLWLRGSRRVGAGFLADLNVIDLEALQLHLPTVAFDLPAGGTPIACRLPDWLRLHHQVGRVTFRGGVKTGDYPGRVIRGPQPAPAESSLPATASDSR